MPHQTPSSAKRADLPKSGLIAAVDLGSSKAAALIARLDGEGGIKVLGFGHQSAKGIANGVIVDLDAAEACIRSTVALAEQMAGETVRDVVVGVSAGLASKIVSFNLDISGHEIGPRDLAAVEGHPALLDAVPEDRALLHRIAVAYRIDGCRSVKDPRGMFGERLFVNMHVLSADANNLRTLDTAFARSHLNPVLHVAQPHAAALGALTPDDLKLGATLIDLGAGTTSVAVFMDGELVHASVIRGGGARVTEDIACGFSTPIDYAERMKTLWGSVIPSGSDDRQVLSVPQIGADASGEPDRDFPRSMLTTVIRPRLEEIFECVADRLDRAGFSGGVGRAVVLTGGAAQLSGVRDLAADSLGRQVRIARPRPISGLPDAASSPSFSACVGLLLACQDSKLLPPAFADGAHVQGRTGAISRFGQWLRDNFWS
ncbi:MAG: cell division protein FtsA [Magnetovibrionaceae bacterium]